MKRVVLVALVLVVVVAAGLVGYRQFVLLPKVRAPLLASLADPRSAQFEDETYEGPWNASDATYCGRVNVKNSMGGYTGFRNFAVMMSGESGKVFFDDPVANLCSDLNTATPWYWPR